MKPSITMKEGITQFDPIGQYIIHKQEEKNSGGVFMLVQFFIFSYQILKCNNNICIT